MRRFIAALLVSTSLLSAPAYAQSKKELAAVDAQLAQRLTTLESRMLTGDPAASHHFHSSAEFGKPPERQ